MKFSELTYTRPELQSINAACLEFEQQAKEADSFETLDKVFIRYDTFIENGFFSDYAIMRIYERAHTNLPDYKEELNICKEVDIHNKPFRKRVLQAILNSPFAVGLTEKYGAYPIEHMRRWAEEQQDTSKIASLLQEEHNLCRAYNEIMDNARINFEGKSMSQHDLSALKDSQDRERRYQIWQVSGKLYEESRPKLDSIFDSLVHNRHQQAEKMGFSNYTDYAYQLLQRDFTREQAEEYRNSIVKHLVPLGSKLMEEQAKRHGISVPFSAADNIPFKEGYPKPIGTSEETLATVFSVFRDLSAETREFIDFMIDNEFIDAERREHKSDTGFCILIPRAKAPYLFSHPSGDIADINSFTHEGGHAFAGYMNRLEPLSWRRAYPAEVAETHSQSMELFFFPYMERLFGCDAAKYRSSHLASSITSICYELLVDHFQHEVYDHPELSPEQRHKVWRKLLKRYRPWIKLNDGIPFFGDGHFWQRQPHIFHSPFYYIDYSLSQITALQFFSLAQIDQQQAWDKYLAFIKKGGTENFITLNQNASLHSPFEESTIRMIGERVGAWLNINA